MIITAIIVFLFYLNYTYLFSCKYSIRIKLSKYKKRKYINIAWINVLFFRWMAFVTNVDKEIYVIVNDGCSDVISKKYNFYRFGVKS